MDRRLLSAACTLAVVLASGEARALDLPKLFKKPLRLDVTEVSIVSQRFLARDDNKPQDFGWGQWINRLNASLVWERITAGVRLDSALYWNRPIDQPDSVVPKNPGLSTPSSAFPCGSTVWQLLQLPTISTWELKKKSLPAC